MSARQMSVTQCAHLVTMGTLYQLELLHIIERQSRYYLEKLRSRRVFHQHQGYSTKFLPETFLLVGNELLMGGIVQFFSH